MAPLLANKKIILTVGGDNEAKDVRWEVPILRDFLKNQWGAPLDYHEYGAQKHDMYKSDQQFLWEMIEDEAILIAEPTAYNKAGEEKAAAEKAAAEKAKQAGTKPVSGQPAKK